jgi:hypothetical protein
MKSKFENIQALKMLYEIVPVHAMKAVVGEFVCFTFRPP